MIRDATEADLEAIVGIYNASIPGRLATADTDPVSVESRRAWLRDRDFARRPIWVAVGDGDVSGGGPEGAPEGAIDAWLSFGAFYGRPAYAATAEVSIYVAPGAQRRGLATRLMEQALARADDLGIRTFLGFVFAHNERSVALCRKFGFERWGHLPRVATLDGVERDLLILGRRLATSPEVAARSAAPADAAAVRIRPYEERDEAEVVALWTRCGLVRPWNDPRKDIARKLAVQRELFLFGAAGDRIAATVMAGYEGHRGWLNYLAVDPDRRRQGLGRTLVDVAEAGLRRLGCAKINLQIRRDNPEVIAFYRRIGFAEDAVVSMSKRLESDEG